MTKYNRARNYFHKGVRECEVCVVRKLCDRHQKAALFLAEHGVETAYQPNPPVAKDEPSKIEKLRLQIEKVSNFLDLLKSELAELESKEARG